MNLDPNAAQTSQTPPRRASGYLKLQRSSASETPPPPYPAHIQLRQSSGAIDRSAPGASNQVPISGHGSVSHDQGRSVESPIGA